MKVQNCAYWNEKYVKKNTGWDLGEISKPLKEYFNQLKDKKIRVLIPGAGNSYEAEYLFKLGFKNVVVIDWAKTPLENIQKRIPNFPTENLIEKDFFEHQGEYDLIIEQTFFCALSPTLRTRYISKMSNLLAEKGKLVGLLFNIPLNTEHPPYGGDKKEYESMFLSNFDIKTMETAHNSIEPRMGNELFVILEKK